MKREEQDKIWNDLSDESKVIIQDEWLKLAIEEEHDDLDIKGVYKKLSLEDVFGKHNLQPSLTYEDVARELFESGYYYYDYVYDEIVENSAACEMPMACNSRKQVEKICALNRLLNVAKFLNKNEDGSDWVPDWENDKVDKWYPCIEKGKLVFRKAVSYNSHIVYFRELHACNQVLDILGEEVIKTALTTKY